MSDKKNWFNKHKALLNNIAIFSFVILVIIISMSIGSAIGDNIDKDYSNDVTINNDVSKNYYPNKEYKEPINRQASELLELLSFNCYTQRNYFYIEGQVKNISNKSLENVMAVGTASTEDGEFVKSEDSFIEYNPILAGQTSPFKIMIRHNPAISRCSVEFKELWGGTISTKKSY